MLTYWIPEGPCMLPSNASHHVGVGGFVINDNNEVHFLLIIMWDCTDLTCFPCTTLTGTINFHWVFELLPSLTQCL